MENLRRWLAICLLLLSGSFATPNQVSAQPAINVTFQTFYNELVPYGRWVNYQNYGQVWIPQVESGFQPYATRGHWIVTDYGNTWVSDYSWGWAPFHYGRWLRDDYYGWIWVPGNEWSPAWVAWRSGGDYYGWAPLSPGVNVNIAVNIPLLNWVFVPGRHITNTRIYDYYVPRRNVVNIYNNTTIINNYYDRGNNRYVYGPRPRDIERYTNRPVVIHHINNSDRPGRAEVRNGYISIYKPEVNGRWNNDRNAFNTRPQDRNGRMEESGKNYPRNDRDVNDRMNRSFPNSPGNRNDHENIDRNRRNQPSSERNQRNADYNERYLAERDNRFQEQKRNESRSMEQPSYRQNQEMRQRPQRAENRPEPRQNQMSGQHNERGSGRNRPGR